ncbi:MAG: signal peptidase I [Acidobacteriota bacterium]
MRPETRDKVLHVWREWVRSLLLVLLIVTAFRSAIADWNDVPTGSMKPTILEGDRIFVNKLAYDLKLPFTTVHLAQWGGPRRGDVVVLFSPQDGTRLVKRVVGLPGDVIAMVNERLVVNGEAAEYQPMDDARLRELGEVVRGRIVARERVGARTHPIMITPGIAAMRSFGPVTVPAGDYFVLGDNRDESGDSRYFGFVPRDRIAGRALAVAASVDPTRYFLPRFGRFFQALP